MLTSAARKLIRSLKLKKFRDQEGLFVVEGVKMVQEALDSPYRVRQIYTQEGNLFPKANATVITYQEMAGITHLANPSPALALVEKKETFALPSISEIDKSQLYLGLDAIRDPGNFGTIIRIADWFGIKAIFASPDCVELYNSKVIHASMGALFRVLVYYIDLAEIIGRLNIPVWGTALHGDSVYKTALSDNGIIIIGNEANGISPALLEKIEHILFIPSYQHQLDSCGSESLNAAISTAIICSEFRRRKS